MENNTSYKLKLETNKNSLTKKTYNKDTSDQYYFFKAEKHCDNDDECYLIFKDKVDNLEGKEIHYLTSNDSTLDKISIEELDEINKVNQERQKKLMISRKIL